MIRSGIALGSKIGAAFVTSTDGIYLLLNIRANSFSKTSVNFGSLGYGFSTLSILVVGGAGKLAADGLRSKRDGGVRKLAAGCVRWYGIGIR